MKYLFLGCLAFICCCSHKQYPNPHVLIETNAGDIEAEIFTKQAPISGNAFLSFVDMGYYKNSRFYRVINTGTNLAKFSAGFIQGGLWGTNDSLVARVSHIAHEPPKQTGISHINGTLSLARTAPGTAGTEFFICIGDQSQLDSSKLHTPDGLGYAAFGRVVDGMDVVRKIQALDSHENNFLDPVTIQNIKRL